jgi:hypothetical protein
MTYPTLHNLALVLRDQGKYDQADEIKNRRDLTPKFCSILNTMM